MVIQSDVSDSEQPNASSAREIGGNFLIKNFDRINTKCRTRTTQRSFNAMLCGCLSSRSSGSTSLEQPSVNINVQLLPSSALQSMKRLSLTSQGDASSRSVGGTKRSENICSSNQIDKSIPIVIPPSAHLPSSAILTDALLCNSRATDSDSGIHSQGSPRVVTRNRLWRKFRLKWKKSEDTVLSNVKKENGSQVSPTSLSNSVMDGCPLTAADNAEIREALVFSPLPSQAVPEPTTTSHHAALLGPRSESDKGKKCFVIDLDETLVHSSFKMVEQADFKVGVEIDGITHRVYVLKRPYVDAFLSTMANLYECVLFTASLAKYADPVADFIDKWNAFRYRLFRESCVFHRGNYVKDLSHLGRPINQIVILDNSPASYMFHASHAVQISSWFDDANDRALLDLIPYFERLASHPNVVEFLRTNTPPTPYAAVGTVGLPATALPHLPASDAVGRSTDSGAIISSIRRPAVASPLPVTLHDTRLSHGPHRRDVPTVTAAISTIAEPRKVQPQGIAANQRLPGTSTLPIITKLAAPGGGTPAERRPVGQESTASFPAPLSLATYVPVPSPPSSAVLISNSTSGNSTQARVGDGVNNSHNPPTALQSSTSSASVSRPSPPSHGTVDRLPPIKVDHSLKVPALGHSDSCKPAVHRHSVKPVCSSSGENHHLGIDNAPRRLGTVKSLPTSTPPLKTSSPPFSVTPNPVSTKRIIP